MSLLDLDAYAERIGHHGTRQPTLSTLHTLTALHTQSIPFENLDVLLGRGISLRPEDVFDKLVRRGRGGYCFEQNSLFLDVLAALGFTVRPLSARVRWQRQRDFTPPRTHVFVRVEVDGASWLTDVGVGGMSLTSALRLEPDVEQLTPHEPRRLVFEEGRWFHQVRIGDEWLDVCEFTLEEMPPVDRDVANWFTSAHPKSHFRNRLLVARATPDGGRLTLLNRDVTRRHRDGTVVHEEVASPARLLAVLAAEFGLTFPSDTHFECDGLVW